MTLSQKFTVSVIIPVYNGAAYITKAIQSINSQTYSNVEIIVIDDGSTDDTEKVVKSFPSKLPIRYVAQTNQGPAAARNHGVRIATGDMIAFLDADDQWHANKLELQMRLFADHEDIGLVFANAKRISQSGEKLADFFSITTPHGGVVTEQLLDQNFLPMLTVVVRTALVRQVEGFDNTLKTSEDYDLWLRLSRITSFAFVSEVLATYLVRPHSVSSNQRQLLDSDIAVLKKFVREFPVEARRFRKRIANHLHLHLIVYNLIDVTASRAIFLDLARHTIRHWKLVFVYLSSFLPRPLMVLINRSRRIEKEMAYEPD